jgi:hypothetical protein
MFREKVKSMLEAFLRELATMQEDFTRLQPTTKDGVSSTTALAFISKWKGLVDAARQKVSRLPTANGQPASRADTLYRSGPDLAVARPLRM